MSIDVCLQAESSRRLVSSRNRRRFANRLSAVLAVGFKERINENKTGLEMEEVQVCNEKGNMVLQYNQLHCA